jgi:hypothetical protein
MKTYNKNIYENKSSSNSSTSISNDKNDDKKNKKMKMRNKKMKILKLNSKIMKNLEAKKQRNTNLLNLSEKIQNKIYPEKKEKNQTEKEKLFSKFSKITNFSILNKNNNNSHENALDEILTNTLYKKVIKCFLYIISGFPGIKNHLNEISEIFSAFKFEEILNKNFFEIIQLSNNDNLKIFLYYNDFFDNEVFKDFVNFPFRTFVKKYMNYDFPQRLEIDNNFGKFLGVENECNFHYFENNLIKENIFLAKILENA